MEKNCRKTRNNFSLVGKFKNFVEGCEPEEIVSKNNKIFLKCKMKVEVEIGNEIHNFRVEFFCGQALKSVYDKNRKIFGNLEPEDKIEIKGSVALDEFYSKDEELRCVRKLNGFSINIPKDETIPDEIHATVEGIFMGIEPNMNDKEKKIIKLLTVKWDESVSEMELDVNKEDAESIGKYIKKGQTVMFTFHPRNFVEVEEAPVVESFFGEVVENPSVSEFVDEWLVKGGRIVSIATDLKFPPYTKEQIKELFPKIESQREELLQKFKEREVEEAKSDVVSGLEGLMEPSKNENPFGGPDKNDSDNDELPF